MPGWFQASPGQFVGDVEVEPPARSQQAGALTQEDLQVGTLAGQSPGVDLVEAVRLEADAAVADGVERRLHREGRRAGTERDVRGGVVAIHAQAVGQGYGESTELQPQRKRRRLRGCLGGGQSSEVRREDRGHRAIRSPALPGLGECRALLRMGAKFSACVHDAFVRSEPYRVRDAGFQRSVGTGLGDDSPCGSATDT